MKKVVVVLVLMLMLAGCNGKAATKTVCELHDDNVSTIFTLDAMDDKLSNFTEEITLYYAYYGVSNEVDIDAVYDELTSKYKDNIDIDGVEVTIDKTNDAYVITTSIDYSKADIKKLQEAGLVGGEVNITFISLDLTIKELTNQGFNCK